MTKPLYVVVVPVLPDEPITKKVADYVVESHSISECWDHVDRYLCSVDLPYHIKQKKKAACYFANNIPQQYLDTIGSIGYIGVFNQHTGDALMQKSFSIAWFDLKLFLAGGYRNSVGYYADGEGQPVLVLIAFPKWSKP
jgi:hypothetical protein